MIIEYSTHESLKLENTQPIFTAFLRSVRRAPWGIDFISVKENSPERKEKNEKRGKIQPQKAATNMKTGSNVYWSDTW